MRGADLLVKTLADSGVKHISSLSGNQIMPIYDASIDSGVELYHVRQEAAAVHMADAWGRLTGQPGIALVTAGPGFASQRYTWPRWPSLRWSCSVAMHLPTNWGGALSKRWLNRTWLDR